MPGFAKIASPLHALKCKDKEGKAGNNPARRRKQQPVVWNNKVDEAFSTQEFTLDIDASLQGLGACLLQSDDDGYLHPVAYASRGLRGAEKNYGDFSSFKIELLGLKWAVSVM